MFQVTKKGSNRLDIDFSGKLDRDGMNQALDELFRQSEGISHGRMLYRIGEFNLPALGAIAIELARLPQLLRFIRRFERVAVISDKGWLRTASEIEGALIPGLEIRAFPPSDEDKAEAWLV